MNAYPCDEPYCKAVDSSCPTNLFLAPSLYVTLISSMGKVSEFGIPPAKNVPLQPLLMKSLAINCYNRISSLKIIN